MKNNKKGFTLIELLAVIVILAIIMVIAVPQILKVIDESRTSSWKNSVKMVERAIELEASLIKPENTTSTSGGLTKISTICSNANANNANWKAIVDVGDMTVTCSSNTFTLTGKNQFQGKSATITCVEATGACSNSLQ